MNPEVSVVMTIYNTREENLKAAVESILNQTYKNFEFIIVDDGSTAENIKNIIESYDDKRIKYYYKNNTGIAESANFGISKACGEYIARMDSDDISLEYRLEKQTKFFKNNPDISVCGSWYKIISANKIKRLPSNPRFIDFLCGCCIANPTVMFRKADFDKYNLHYNKDYLCEDYELWSRAVRYLKFANIQEVLLLYRHSGQGITTQRAEEIRKDSIRVRKNMLNFLSGDKNIQKKIKKLIFGSADKYEKNSFLKTLFSIRNADGLHKTVTVFGKEFKFKKL